MRHDKTALGRCDHLVLRIGIANTRHDKNRPGAGEGPGRTTPHIGGGGGSSTRGNRQSAPWREEDAQGALAFRIGYLSLGASFTS